MAAPQRPERPRPATADKLTVAAPSRPRTVAAAASLPVTAAPDPPVDPVAAVVAAVATAAEGWRDLLTVSIGRASALSGLKEHQIRYYESLGVLSPAKTAERAGASRLYDLGDLRRLHALSLLASQGHRPADAAAIVSANAAAIETGDPRALPALLAAERGAVADGFLLARLASQLIDAAQAELDARFGPGVAPVRELFLLTRAGPDALQTPAAELGPRLRAAIGGVLVAQRHHERDPLMEQIPLPLLAGTGRDDRTTLVYSAEQRALPADETLRFCRYSHPERPELAVLFAVAAPQLPLEDELRPSSPARAAVMSAGLRLCADLLPGFAQVPGPRGYRYRSDGFELGQTREVYRQLLRSLRAVIFPDDPDSLAAILAPDNLDQPLTLSILAHDGYDDELAYRVRLDLHDEGQGLCGRAYRLREPFLSRNARRDTRAAFAVEENAHVALALPLAASWGISPFGVLYLASRREGHALGGDLAYAAMLIADVLSEQLGRWWLTRLRGSRDRQLLRSADDLARWVDSLDEGSPDFCAALDAVAAIWAKTDGAEARKREGALAIALIDIDHYRERIQARQVESLSMRAQRHVRAAINRVLPETRAYWFKHDHALLVLDGYDARRAEDVLARIALQVRSLPLEVGVGRKAEITVSAAVKALSYQNLHDLDPDGGEGLREQVRALIGHLRDQTGASEGDQIVLLA